MLSVRNSKKSSGPKWHKVIEAKDFDTASNEDLLPVLGKPGKKSLDPENYIRPNMFQLSCEDSPVLFKQFKRKTMRGSSGKNTPVINKK